ncbi:MAG: hypothetical protein BMS9Abin07_1664 [Acidimicrobiia bacterium]|nr:MAG: hypothetical protein BMS9Abin07_1664 [Acidimicrobiia bacterium]
MSAHQHEQLSDPDLPALSTLLGADADELLSGVLAELGARLVSSRIMQIRYVPGRSVTVQYRVEAEQHDGGKRREIFVASAGIEVPDHVPVLGADGIEIAVWRFPHDPFLPGLAPATDPDQIRGVLEQLGVIAEQVRLSTRAYRPGRRAVVEVVAPQARIFVKVLRPSRIADLQRLHRAMAGSVPVPHSLGWSEDLGLVAMQAMHGRTLRKALESGTKRLPEGAQLRSLLDALPADPGASPVTGPRRSATNHAGLLRAVTPELGSRIDAIVDAVAGGPDEPTVPVHGDFHSSQVLVKGPEIVGLIDVDTVGVGYRSDDYGSILGHLATLSLMSSSRRNLTRYGAALIKEFDATVDPIDLRLAIAASVFALATGPFRVSETNWPTQTERRISLAERWIESANDLSDVPT